MTRSRTILVLLGSLVSLAAAAPTASAANDVDTGRRPYAAPAAFKGKAQPDAARIKYERPAMKVKTLATPAAGVRIKYGQPNAIKVRGI